jgi:hypothetical protein
MAPINRLALELYAIQQTALSVIESFILSTNDHVKVSLLNLTNVL